MSFPQISLPSSFSSVLAPSLQSMTVNLPIPYTPMPSTPRALGGGNKARRAHIKRNGRGYAALDIQDYGDPVGASEYTKLPKENLTPDQPEEFIHYRVHLNTLQGARVLKQLPGAAPDKLAVLGSSLERRLA